MLLSRKTAAGFGILEHIEPFQECELVAGDEIGGIDRDQVWSLDRFGAEAQVRYGQSAGFLGVIIEVTLSIVVCLFTDDLDRVLIGANGAIRTQAENSSAQSQDIRPRNLGRNRGWYG